MNILILYQFSNHDQTIDSLCHNLSRRGIKVSSFNIVSFRFRNGNKKGRRLWLSLLYIIGLIPKLNSLVFTLLRFKVILELVKTYNIIDIQYFSYLYDELIKEFKKSGKKVKITIWGSDFYRVKTARREEQQKIYKIVDIIQIETRQIANDFFKVFPECSEKVRIAHFGLTQFDIIDELLKKGNSNVYRKKWKIPENKIVLTCGTNRSESQQHLRIIDSIEKLPYEIKTQIFLIFPMTYGGIKSYSKIVRERVNTLGVPYKIIASFQSKHNIAKLNIISNIIISIQITDALSCSIQEHLYAENILILGSWLPYVILDDNGIFYLTSTREDLSRTISKTLENFASLKSTCTGNKDKEANLSSWDQAIKEWLAIYDELDSRILN